MDVIIGLAIGIGIVLLYQLIYFVVWSFWFNYSNRKRWENMPPPPTVEDFSSGRLRNYCKLVN